MNATATPVADLRGRAVATTQKAPPKDFPQMLSAWQPEIARALPKHLNADRMTRIALTCFRQVPKLAQCDPKSVFAAVIQAAQIGLEPGLLGQCYLIPFKESCQLVIGYQGLLDLVRRSGLVNSIEAHVVYESDHFELSYGLVPALVHKPELDKAAGQPRLAYAVARLKDGGTHVEVMSRSEIEAIRDRSQNVINAKRYSKQTPWDTDPMEMWRKTVIRRICKYLPKSPELSTAIALSERADLGVAQNLNLQDALVGDYVPPAIEGESHEIVDTETGEVTQTGGTEKQTAPPEREQEQAPPTGTDAPQDDPAPRQQRQRRGSIE